MSMKVILRRTRQAQRKGQSDPEDLRLHPHRHRCLQSRCQVLTVRRVLLQGICRTMPRHWELLQLQGHPPCRYQRRYSWYRPAKHKDRVGTLKRIKWFLLLRCTPLSTGRSPQRIQFHSPFHSSIVHRALLQGMLRPFPFH